MEMSPFEFPWGKRNQFSAISVLNFLPPFAGGAGVGIGVCTWPEIFQSESPENVQLKSKESKP